MRRKFPPLVPTHTLERTWAEWAKNGHTRCLGRCRWPPTGSDKLCRGLDTQCIHPGPQSTGTDVSFTHFDPFWGVLGPNSGHTESKPKNWPYFGSTQSEAYFFGPLWFPLWPQNAPVLRVLWTSRVSNWPWAHIPKTGRGHY